jgi:hypothetical protein
VRVCESVYRTVAIRPRAPNLLHRSGVASSQQAAARSCARIRFDGGTRRCVRRLHLAAQALTDADARNAEGVALWDAEGDDDAFQKELDGVHCGDVVQVRAAALTFASCTGAVAEEPAREPSGGRDSGKARAACSLCTACLEVPDSQAGGAQKPRAAQAREERRLDGADYLSRHGLSHSGAPGTRRAIGCEDPRS